MAADREGELTVDDRAPMHAAGRRLALAAVPVAAALLVLAAAVWRAGGGGGSGAGGKPGR